MIKKYLFIFTICYLSTLIVSAQDKTNLKFGKISPDDFKTTVYTIDSNASAVVLADIGSTRIVGNNKGWFSLEYRRHKRVHILNKNGYDAAVVKIPLYVQGTTEETLDDLRAYTYNLENGKVVDVKLEKANIFKDKQSKNWIVKKFTFPAIKEGSIIEFEYTVNSEYLFNLQPWEFQGEYPHLWSEYTVSIPQFLSYVFIAQGMQSFFLKDHKDKRENYTVSDSRGATATERSSFTTGVADSRWVMKDVPALKEESFTSTLDNHIARINFQLAEYRDPLVPKNVMGTWTQVTSELLLDEDFGGTLAKNNGWMSDVIKPLLTGAGNDLEKAKRIYAYVRDNFTCTVHSGFYLHQPIKNVLKTKNGTVAEINLLLVAMLKYADIQADPVLLSTRSHGYAYALYPILDKFNYVICFVTIDGREWYLDASYPRLGFGHLNEECYNGHARVVNQVATPIQFSSDSLREKKLTSVFIINDEKGEMEGSVQQFPGYYESLAIRNKIKEKGQEEYLKDVTKGFGSDISIANPKIDSLNKLEDNIGVSYEFVMKGEKSDIIYMNPMFGEGHRENYFKSAERLYPVEMPHTIDETYLLQLEIPKGYEVDELPKQIIVKLNEEGDGMFEYRISSSNGTISLRSIVRISRTYFQPDEYEMLREFFNMIVKKHSEQIVFKKKK